VASPPPAHGIDPANSLTTRFRRAAFSLTMLVVICIGLTSLLLSLWEIPRKEETLHNNTLRVIGVRMVADIRSRLNNVRQLSQSSMVWTALTDTSDREMYLKPYLAGLGQDDAELGVVLLDYRGRLTAGELHYALTDPDLIRLVEGVLKDKRSHLLVHPHDATLLAAYPVLYPYTQDAIGVLLGGFDLRTMFATDVAGLDHGHGVALRHNGQPIVRVPEPPPAAFFPVRTPLLLPELASGTHLELELYSLDYDWLMPPLEQLLIYLVVGWGVATLVWPLSERLAGTLTNRLNQLVYVCTQVAEGRPLLPEVQPGSDEIALLSRTLHDALLALRQIQDHLEERVEERTRALQESEERYRQGFEINTAVKLLINPEDGSVVDANEAACAFYGYSRAQLLEMKVSDINILSPEAIRTEMENALAEHRLYFRFQHRLASGEIRDVEVYSGPITVRHRRLLHSIIHDVTERRRAVAALRESERRFRTYVESSPVPVAVVDAHGDYQEANPAALAMLGYDLPTLRSKNFFDLAPAEEREALQQRFATLMATGHMEGDIQRVCADGSVIWITVRAVAIEQGRFLLFAQDITQRKRDEQVLRDSQARYQTLFESMADALFVYEIEPITQLGQLIECNQFAVDYTGYSRAELLGKNLRDLEAPNSEVKLAAMVQTLHAGQAISFEQIHLSQQGEPIPVEIHAHAFLLEGRQVAISIVRDIRERKRSEAALRQAEEKYRSVVESIKQGVFQIDNTNRWSYLNPAWEEITGFTVAEVLGHNSADALLPTDRARYLKTLAPLFAHQAPLCRDQFRFLYHSGGYRWVELFAQATSDSAGHYNGISGTLTDITERRAAETQLRLAASVFQHSHEGIVLTDREARIIDVNDAFTRITGYSRHEVVGQNPRFLKSGHQDPTFYANLWQALEQRGFWQGEVWNRSKQGEVYPELLTISAVHDEQGGTSHYVGVFADISPLKSHEQQLERIAHYDALTQLPNRILLADRMQQALAQAKRAGHRVAVCYLDLDGFKAVNDTRGHAAGDELLTEVARRLKAWVREGDTVARLGGDEFVLLLLGLESVDQCEEILARVNHAIAEPVFLSGTPVSVSASIGVALFPDTDGDADTLLRYADQAMYGAKEAGKNRFQLVSMEQDRYARRRRALLRELDLALERNELLLHYQPKVNLHNGQVVGVEALLRWRHPKRGLLAPNSFLFDLNHAPLEIRIGRWVLESTLAQGEQWRANGLTLGLSVNISAPHLEAGDFPDHIEQLMAQYPWAKGRFELEVLESAAVEDIDRVAQLMRACQAAGVSFALDDFGTGYSSLTYFRRLPAETLKIDKSFVITMLENSDDHAIVEGVLGLTTAFGRTAIAEGVESAAHGHELMRLGCHLVQGYGIAPPMPAEEIPAWVNHWNAHPEQRLGSSSSERAD